HVSLEHLKQQMRPAASGMLLLSRGAIARTHHTALRAAALANANATQRGAIKRALLAELELRRLVFSMIRFTQSQILRDLVRADDFARIHLSLRIPDRFELFECADQFGAKHFWQKFGTRLAVAMLSRK